MNEPSVTAAFEQWWRDSYGLPPGKHAVMTHVAFAMYILQLLEFNTTPEGSDDSQ